MNAKYLTDAVDFGIHIFREYIMTIYNDKKFLEGSFK